MKYLNLFACLLFTCFANGQQAASFKIPYEKFTLSNGLQVIFHIDKSDPVVAVSLTAHVGFGNPHVSSSENPGVRSGPPSAKLTERDSATIIATEARESARSEFHGVGLYQ